MARRIKTTETPSQVRERWDRLIADKKKFTPKQLGLKGGRRAKQAYIARLERHKNLEIRQAEQGYIDQV